LTDIAYPNDSFDVVTLNHVIEHAEDPLSLLEECRRILKPGGKIVVLTPNVTSLGSRVFGNHWRGLEPPRHYHLFGLRTFEVCCTRAVFRTVSATTTERMSRHLFRESMMIRRRNRGREQESSFSSLERATSYCYQFIEYLFLKCGIQWGEEIYYVGVK